VCRSSSCCSSAWASLGDLPAVPPLRASLTRPPLLSPARTHAGHGAHRGRGAGLHRVLRQHQGEAARAAVRGPPALGGPGPRSHLALASTKDRVAAALADDFDTPGAMSALQVRCCCAPWPARPATAPPRLCSGAPLSCRSSWASEPLHVPARRPPAGALPSYRCVVWSV